MHIENHSRALRSAGSMAVHSDPRGWTTANVFTEHGIVAVYMQGGDDPYTSLEIVWEGRIYTRQFHGKSYTERGLTTIANRFARDIVGGGEDMNEKTELSDEQKLREAMGRAFNLGQTYWQQADSLSSAQHRKSDATLAKFRALVEETVAASPYSKSTALTDALEDFDNTLSNWAKAYPLSVFPEPDWDAVRVALQAAGIKVDSISGSNMRHVAGTLNREFQKIREALASSSIKEDGERA